MRQREQIIPAAIHLRLSALAPGLDAQRRNAKETVISKKPERASFRSSIRRSACRAETSTSCMPASDAALKSPAIPGTSHAARQKPAVMAKAAMEAFLKA